MSFAQGAFLVVAAALGGALNAVAGGGSFLTFPALLLTGVPPIEANATSTVALWPGSVASAVGYRRELSYGPRVLLWLGVPSLMGGVLGAALLVGTPPRVFMRVVPFLLLAATLIFTFGERLRAAISRWSAGRIESSEAGLWAVALAQAPIAIYGGYFGGGMGLMMLAAFALLGMQRIHRMNGLKALLGVAINGSAIVTFVLSGVVEWLPGAVMIGGAIAGGYGGAALAMRVDPRWTRTVVIATGWLITGYFFVRYGLGP